MCPLSKITINVGQGGLGRRPLNKDKISGLLFYNDTVPSGFVTNVPKKVFTLAEAVALGIVEGSASADYEHYHIKEFFKANPEGELFIEYFPVPVPVNDFVEVTEMMNDTNGEIRLLGVVANSKVGVLSAATILQAIIDPIKAAGQRFACLLHMDFSATADFTAALDFRTLSADDVFMIGGEDGGGVGAAIAVTRGESVGCIGALLGALSKAKVNQSVGNPANFNISDGVEFEVPALINGELVSAFTATALGAVKDKGYAIIRKYLPEIAGSFFERIPASNLITSDFAFIENTRVMDKAVRLINTVLTPQLQAGLNVKSDGTLTDDTIGFFKDKVQTELDAMITAGEIADGNVQIDPAQDVAATSTLVITVNILPTGIAEFITLNIGFVTQIV